MKIGDTVVHRQQKIGEWSVVSVNEGLRIARVENKAGDVRAFQLAVLKVRREKKGKRGKK